MAPDTEVLSVTFAGTPAVAPGGRCPVLTATINFPGEADPGGPFTVNQTQCLDPANPGIITDGEFTWSFTNGDALSGTYQGVTTPSGTPGIVNIDEDFTITSGAGEFEGASGRAQAIGTFNEVTRAAAVTAVAAFTH
ncbi:MAG: hypothetical protein H0V09_11945 [Gemmatimonadetes bacterium]|nr:hypothetical protein [Gemmatimonadota bacterium]